LDLINIINFVIGKTLEKKNQHKIKFLPLPKQIKPSLSITDILKIINNSIQKESSNSQFIFRAHSNNKETSFFVKYPKTFVFFILTYIIFIIVSILLIVRKFKRMDLLRQLEDKKINEQDNDELDYSKKIYFHTPKPQKKTIAEIMHLKV
jgi:hypothetical protein